MSKRRLPEEGGDDSASDDTMTLEWDTVKTNGKDGITFPSPRFEGVTYKFIAKRKEGEYQIEIREPGEDGVRISYKMTTGRHYVADIMDDLDATISASPPRSPMPEGEVEMPEYPPEAMVGVVPLARQEYGNGRPRRKLSGGYRKAQLLPFMAFVLDNNPAIEDLYKRGALTDNSLFRKVGRLVRTLSPAGRAQLIGDIPPKEVLMKTLEEYLYPTRHLEGIAEGDGIEGSGEYSELAKAVMARQHMRRRGHRHPVMVGNQPLPMLPPAPPPAPAVPDAATLQSLLLAGIPPTGRGRRRKLKGGADDDETDSKRDDDGVLRGPTREALIHTTFGLPVPRPQPSHPPPRPNRNRLAQGFSVEWEPLKEDGAFKWTIIGEDGMTKRATGIRYHTTPEAIVEMADKEALNMIEADDAIEAEQAAAEGRDVPVREWKLNKYGLLDRPPREYDDLPARSSAEKYNYRGFIYTFSPGPFGGRDSPQDWYIYDSLKNFKAGRPYASGYGVNIQDARNKMEAAVNEINRHESLATLSPTDLQHTSEGVELRERYGIHNFKELISWFHKYRPSTRDKTGESPEQTQYIDDNFERVRALAQIVYPGGGTGRGRNRITDPNMMLGLHNTKREKYAPGAAAREAEEGKIAIAKAQKFNEDTKRAQDKEADNAVWNIGSDVVGTVGDLVGKLPGLGQFASPILGVASKGLKALGSGRRKRKLKGGARTAEEQRVSKKFEDAGYDSSVLTPAERKIFIALGLREGAEVDAEEAAAARTAAEAKERKHQEELARIRHVPRDVLERRREEAAESAAALARSARQTELLPSSTLGEAPESATEKKKGKKKYSIYGTASGRPRKLAGGAHSNTFWDGCVMDVTPIPGGGSGHKFDITTSAGNFLMSQSDPDWTEGVAINKGMNAHHAAHGGGVAGGLSAKLTKLLKGAGIFDSIYKGSGPIPDRNILQQLATQSYEANPAPRIGQMNLLRATPTLKFYKPDANTIVVAIRGTKPTDMGDVKADALIALGQLESSDRYKTDLNTLQQFQTQYPPSQYDYYGVGHSLGGAILDLFLKQGLLKNGVSYNPAVQPQDFQGNLPNQRVYMESDPLYKIMGSNLAQKPEIRAPRKKSWWEKAISVIPYVGTAAKGYDLYQSHMLDQFQGGNKPHPKFEAQLRKVGIEPSSYLKEAQRRAKDAGLPHKVLGFADDGIHKLVIPDAEGRMVKFGRAGYKDHQIWAHLESGGKVPKGSADAKKNTFHKSHSAIKGDWKKNPFSPNNLALKVLW